MDAILDRSVVNAIKELGDHRANDSLLRELFDLFTTQVELAKEALKAGVEDLDLAKIRHHAHKLKGSAANLGASHLASRCQLLEQLAKQNVADAVALRLAWSQVEAAIGKSVASLKDEIAN